MGFNKIINYTKSKSGYFTFISAFLAILTLSLHNEYLPPLLIIWTVFWLFDFISRNGRITEDEKHIRLLLYFFLGLYLIFFSGLLYSENFKEGVLLLFRRLSLLIFPVILFSPGNEIKKSTGVLLRVFVTGIIIFLAFCYCYALSRSLDITNGKLSFDPHSPEEPWLNYFYGEKLSYNQHPSYIAMYTLMGMFISLEFYFNKSLKNRERILWFAAALFLFISVYFLSSRASFLATLIILPIYLWFKINPKRLKLLSLLSLIFLISLILTTFLKNQRVSLYFDKAIDPSVLRSGRTEIWKSAFLVVEKNPLFGVGIGDYYDAMDKEFRQSGYTIGYYKDFNAHNQYLEILCSSGSLGFLVFLIIIGLMVLFAVKDKNLLYGVFIIIMLIFFSFESILSRLAGNSFFALFSFLLLHYKGSQLPNKDQVKTTITESGS